MPQEVFDLWIAPHIPDYGWPFSSEQLSVVGTRWERFFAGRELYFWRDCTWLLHHITLTEDLFERGSRIRILSIVEHCTTGAPTPTANVQDTQQRLWACASYIREHRRLPQPLIGIATFDGLELLDGHHRVAALSYLGARAGGAIPVWLAIPGSA